MGMCHSYLLGINVVSSSKCIVLALQVIIIWELTIVVPVSEDC